MTICTVMAYSYVPAHEKIHTTALSHKLDCGSGGCNVFKRIADTQHSPEKLTHFYMSSIRSELICKEFIGADMIN